MGCTSSSAAAPGSNRPSRAVNTTTVPVQRPGVVSRPLVSTRNYRHGSPITPRDLQVMRENFWSTRTEGNPQMWHNIRSVAEALAANDVVLANAILEASEIVSPSGTMDTLYDERGAQYKVPIYCTSNPVELVGESPGAGVTPTLNDGNYTNNNTNSSSSNSNINNNSTSLPVATVASVSATGDRSSPVKATSVRAVDGKPLNLKIRINPGDLNLQVAASSGHSIGDLKKLIVQQSLQSPTPMPKIDEDRQRILFMGKELQNNQILSAVGFDEQKVVQVFMRPQR